MVFKIICLFFHIVDLILSVIDMTRGFITSNIKRLSSAKEEDGSNATPALVMYLAILYYIYSSCSQNCGRGNHVRDGITDWGQYPK